MEKTYSRRSFVEGAAAALVAGTAAAALASSSEALADEAEEETTEEEEAAEEETADVEEEEDEEPEYSFLVAPDPIDESLITETYTSDIVVVGAGISGIPAAAIAAEMGASVRCIEKQSIICSTRPTGYSAFGSEKLKEQGVMCTEEEKERMVLDVWGGSNATSNQKLVKLWADNSGAFADWLNPIVEDAGIPVTVGGFFGYYNHNETLEEAQEAMREDPLQVHDSYYQFYPLQHQFGSSTVPGISMWSQESTEAMYADADWLTPLYNYAVDQGVEFDFNTRGYYLEREEGWEDDPSKRVTAVIAQVDEDYYVRYEATKGIILATGGFDWDDDMVDAFYPIGLRMCRTWQTWMTGDGHKMAWWVGGKVDDQYTAHSMGTCAPAMYMLSEDKMTPSESEMHVTPWQEWNMPSTAMAPCLWVNNNGERFINEEVGYFMSMTRIDAQPEHMYWGVWDSEWQTKIEPHHMDRIMDGNDDEERMAANVEAGMAIMADTIDELIEQMGLDDDAAETFKETLENYNAMCEAGEDSEFYKPSEYLSTVDTPPYYAAQMGGSWMTTCGGVVVDTDLHVLDTNDKVIPGLYAGGNPAGGFYGNIYSPQIPMSLSGHSMTLSWLAAQNAVNEI